MLAPLAGSGGPRLERPVGAAVPPRVPGMVHWRGLWTVFARDMLRFLKSWPETIVATVFTSALYLVVFALAIGPDRSTPEGQAAFWFIVPGVVLFFTVMLRAAETTVFSIQFDKMEHIISDVLTPPLEGWELTLGITAAGAAAGLIAGIPGLLLASFAFGLPIVNPGAALLFATLASLLLAILGMLTGLWAQKWDQTQAVFTFILQPFAFLSGLFMPIADLPGFLQPVAYAVPFTYLLDGFRAGITGVGHFPFILNLTVGVLTVATTFWLVGWLINRGWRIKA